MRERRKWHPCGLFCQRKINQGSGNRTAHKQHEDDLQAGAPKGPSNPFFRPKMIFETLGHPRPNSYATNGGLRNEIFAHKIFPNHLLRGPGEPHILWTPGRGQAPRASQQKTGVSPYETGEISDAQNLAKTTIYSVRGIFFHSIWDSC